MAIIKCKMCGGDLALIEGQSVAECEYCGSRQTVPSADSEKKLALFARANKLRAACEFDKAAGIYESIVADFPEEAEAYWGLVLCKYGIEYVDDPASGKKIPTCHRSSFDSVMDDANLDLALENADTVARKVYREEAKQIEEIRKGIIAVSSNEEPYDIFICYKETDENGDRTLDSVLAQDIYDALTDKGYKVFFARITLEDKLGQEYEPYIFAALNSAKIMLAVGTDYEYYNAVWVKNEWSRFLKLMTADKSKHLIPCYKGIDAYDMPKEFARLQAQDLGKMGAIQDILRGVEKLLPRKESNTVVIQEKVVVGGSGDNKIASLLDRGNMALEDGDWAKADSFFEDVLNNDSKNAQAYIGKTLAQEKCRTIDAFIRKRKEANRTVRTATKYAAGKQETHIQEMIEACHVPGFVSKDAIAKLYEFNMAYSTEVPNRMQQYRDEETYWANHKLLSRAEKFATGAVAENLQREKKALFATLADQLKIAKTAEAAAMQLVLERYSQHLHQADEQAQALCSNGQARREQQYRELLQLAKTTANVSRLTETAKKFDALGDYQDSKNLAEHCRKRIADITAAEKRREAEAKAAAAAEAARKAEAARQAAAARAKRNKTIAIITTTAVVLVLIVVMVLTKIVIPGSNYDKAEIMLAQGQFAAAEQIFIDLGDYQDAPAAAEYAAARALLEKARSRDPEIRTLLKQLQDVPPLETKQPEPAGSKTTAEKAEDVPMSLEDWGLELLTEQLESKKPEERQALLNSEKGLQELKAVLEAEGFSDTEIESIFEKYMASHSSEVAPQNPVETFTVDISLPEFDQQVLALYDYVHTLFVDMGDYRDAPALATAAAQERQAIVDNHYAAIFKDGEAYLANQEYEKAMAVFTALDSVMDTSGMAEEAKQAQEESILQAKAEAYAEAASLMDIGEYESAIGIFANLSGYQDSDSQKVSCMQLLAKRYEGAKDLTQAIKWYTAAKDGENVNRVKYQYIQTNKNAKDLTTYEYLKELKSINYKDTENIYKSLYKIQVKLFYNTSKDDTRTSLSSFYMRTSKGWQNGFGHYQVTGGPPVETVKLRFYYETRWGTDNTAKREWEKESDYTKDVAANGADNVLYLASGSNLYYHRVTVYDAETGEQLAQAVLYRPYD